LILQKGAHVLAIEKDTRLADFLRAHFRNERLEILNMDALNFDPLSLFAHRRVKLVGNLPYNIFERRAVEIPWTTNHISLWLLMLQKEWPHAFRLAIYA